MSKKMLVNATHLEENRVAIVADGILTELDIEVSGHEPTKGNIYKAVVVRVEAGLQAAFVDYGAERLGFLQIDEINFETVKPGYSGGENGRSRTRINDLLHRGQELLVQITKEERGSKGAALTTYLSLAGRFMVCMPGSQTRGVSRKVESDTERKQLKKAMAEVDLPEGFGYIVRTAGLGKTKEELQRDFNYLKRLYDGIRELAANAKAPALIYKESNLVIRSIRDYFTTEMDEVLIDDLEVFQEAKDFFQRVMPEHAGLVKLHQERRPIFSRYQIEDQIETISHNKVPLPSGGSIVIDPTEALVSIDVNSGKMTSEQGVESTAFKTNLEAADEVGRQLRLRDLGGLIVIDFIDMRDQKHNRAVENQLRKSLESDKARISVGRISKFGLLEMSRQRIKAALADGTSLTCQHCQGSGRIKSPESLAVGLVRRIHTGVAKGQISHVDAKLPLDVASYLLNYKREDLLDMERRYNVEIHVHGFPNYLTEQIEIDFKKREKEKQSQPEYVEAGALPATASEIIEAAPQSEPDQTAEVNDQPRKKRRRRRRKPAAEKAEQEAAQQTIEEMPPIEQNPAEQGETRDGSTDQTAADQAGLPVEQEAAEAAAKEERPKRRRTRRKKPESQQAAKEVQTAEKAPAAPASSTEAFPAEQSAETEMALKQGEASARSTDQAAVEPTDTHAEQETAETAAAAEKPKPRRTRRKKAESQQATKEPQPAEEAPATASPAESAPAEQPAEQEVKPKPRRRSTRSRTSPKPEEQGEPASAGGNQSGEAAGGRSASTPPTEEKAAAQEEPKPRRRRAPRKKAETKAVTEPSPAPEPATTAAPVAIPEQPASVPESPDQQEKTASQSKPMRRSRRTKTPDQAGEKSAQEPAASPASADAGQTGTAPPEESRQAEPEKPKRRRTTRKKTATQDAPAASETKTKDQGQSTEVPESETKPAPRRRSSRSKKAAAKDQPPREEDSADGGPDQPEATTEDQPKRRRAPRRKPESPAGPAPGPETSATEKPAPEKDKPKRAPRRKTGSSKTKEEAK